MNEELEKQLAKVVEKSLSLAEKTGEFVIDQAPDLLKEFYRWHIIENIIDIVISVLISFIWIKILKTFGKRKPEKYYTTKLLNRYYEGDEMPFFLLCLISVIVLIFTFIMFFHNLTLLIKVLVAPKIYLIEYFIN